MACRPAAGTDQVLLLDVFKVQVAATKDGQYANHTKVIGLRKERRQPRRREGSTRQGPTAAVDRFGFKQKDLLMTRYAGYRVQVFLVRPYCCCRVSLVFLGRGESPRLAELHT
jgi:hypothetical protein